MVCRECSQECVHEIIAEWAEVPVGQITSATTLDGLGDKAWPTDGASLVQNLSELCSKAIPANIWQAWVIVADIDDYLGVGDEEDR